MGVESRRAECILEMNMFTLAHQSTGMNATKVHT